MRYTGTLAIRGGMAAVGTTVPTGKLHKSNQWRGKGVCHLMTKRLACALLTPAQALSWTAPGCLLRPLLMILRTQQRRYAVNVSAKLVVLPIPLRRMNDLT